ncbi:MAG: hypothetical protein IJX75_00750 [Clostridia bacterium]|nr:hypothetical protein [Clostridia bacterium]
MKRNGQDHGAVDCHTDLSCHTDRRRHMPTCHTDRAIASGAYPVFRHTERSRGIPSIKRTGNRYLHAVAVQLWSI